MKSSSNLIRADVAVMSRPVSMWSPADFTPADETTSPAELDAIQELFRPDESTVIWTANGHSPLVKSGAPFSLETWSFPDIAANAAPAAPVWNFPHTAAKPAHTDDNPGFATEEAQVMLSSARRQAEEIVFQAGTTADQIIQEAQEEAERTLEAARQAAREEVQQQAQPMFQALEAMVAQVDAWQKSIFSQAEGQMGQMVAEIARMMFGEGVALDDKSLQTNLSRVLENAHSLGDLKIFLHPQDAATLDAAWRETQAVVIGNRVQIISSDGITRGGCYVQGAMGTVDARVETQLETILEACQNGNDA